jgi:predicted lipid-binding transport protein (Tim44 family)
MPEIDLPTVIFALVALFVAYKLRSVLGMRQDSERQTGGLLAPLRRVPAPPAAPVVQPDGAASVVAPPPAPDRWKGVAEPEPAVWSGLDAIAAADRSFSPQAFLSGARVAYDMVVHAFTAGDSATLRNLMTPEAFANFDNAIRSRAASGQTMTTTVVSIDGATIVGAQLEGATAQIRVRFAAKLASVTRDAQGAVVEGSPSAVADHIDLWTFARDIRSRNPNWMLTATESESGAGSQR